MWRNAFFVTVLLAACAPVDPPINPDGGISSDPSCEAAELRLETLGCVSGPVCSETDCDDFGDRCHALERDLPGYLNLPCLTAATSCEAVDACAQ